MALPTPVKTWQFNVNQALPSTGDAYQDSRVVIFTVKESFKGFGLSPWTVDYSSDSVTAGIPGDGIDRWVSQANCIWEINVGDPHSWIVLNQPGLGGAQLLINLRGTVAGDPYRWIAAYLSPSGSFVGGTINTRPTAVDEVTLRSGIAGDPAAVWLDDVNAPLNYVVHAMQSTDGQVTRVMICANNFVYGFWTIDQVQNPVTGWATPIAACIIGSGNALLNAPTYTKLLSAAPTSALGVGTLSLYMTCEGYAGATVGQNQISACDFDGGWPMLPVGMASNTPANRGRLGTFFDLWFDSTGTNNGDTYPNDASRQFATFGNLIVVWDGSTVVLS